MARATGKNNGAVNPDAITDPAPQGTVVQNVEVQQEATPVDGDVVTIITTAKGTLSRLGIVEPGTKATILLAAYSPNWMKPADAASAKRIKG